ncbi:hypothetical protein P153DRAFT_377319 [Dothidotthia symphoricarpi CBS 119687]|uniref:Uncharacterized protein n=1 Tax=Dothidotthia symphoricarpi CBS 119687 TaxID=1392245 RepID=A0A6A6A8D3_9PLEO|nr:uncharacterized protein P153DRAFT_377319 [Dothidotthia symphoricarpi CBS 119687]KAF2127816.1 hypothetical protein P153DRAFT_377319 [Dothidotthia symphoricarpi CBS 119687]
MVEPRKSDNGTAFLFPPATAANTSTNNNNRLLPSPIPPPTASSVGSHRPRSRLGSSVSGISRDDVEGSSSTAAARKQSVSSTPRTLASSKGSASAAGTEARENREKQRAVRSLPPWVQTADEDDNADVTSLLLPRTPTSIRPASHHYMPTPKSNVPGRKFDHAREGAPVTLTTHVTDSASKWAQFAAASQFDALDRPLSSRGQIVDDAWMAENMPDLEKPWEPIEQDDEAEKLKGFWLFNPAKRRRKVTRWHRTMMNHPIVPAMIRMVVLTFSILALSLAGAIFHRSDSAGCEKNASTWMAMVIDVTAVLYTVYITYDEYTSKPLGLRSHNAKMSLIFLDLAFIVFESANLSLAFQALTDDTWACTQSTGPNSQCAYTRGICVRQKALVATLLIALVAWLGTFTISTLRLIHRVAR